MKVEITQYLRPDGRRKSVFVDVSDGVQEDYEAMQGAGYNLAAEVLMTDVISMTIENDERDADCRIIPRGDESAKDIEGMLKARKWEVNHEG